MSVVYADWAATAPLCPAARGAMLPWLGETFGNPSGAYSLARRARRAVETARENMARALGASSEEISFTSGGTEADNWALLSGAEAMVWRGKHILASPVEHHAVLRTLERLSKMGYTVTYLPCDRAGRVSPEALSAAIRPDTCLVTVMTANNELGTVEPIRELARIAHEKGALFHTDAVQAVGHIPINVKALDVDLLSLSGHKFGGPQGTGALYCRRGLRLAPYLTGGGQENGLRSGTENVAGIVGMAAALQSAVEEMETVSTRLRALSLRLREGMENIPECCLTGARDDRLPGLESYLLSHIEGEALVLALDAAGICASSGSACSVGSMEPSHVLLAAGYTAREAAGSLRLSLGRGTTEEDIDKILTVLPPLVSRLRELTMSAL